MFKLILVLAISAGIFILDVSTPAEYAIWIFYLLPCVYAFYYLSVRRALFVLLVNTGFAILGLFFPGPVHAYDFFNRTPGIVALWVISYVIVRGRRQDHRLEELRKTEEEVRKALQGKELLLKELYHRTKNNMNIISSLLNLQMGEIDNPEIKQLLKESQGRIQVMALVHEMLYKSKKLSELDLRDYLEQLAGSILAAFKTKDISLRFDMDSVPASLYLAIPLGLILNELMSNTIKYAFPETASGEILIQLKTKEDEIEFTYSDNGIGLPDGFRTQDSSSLGLKLVDGLVKKQLLGSLKIASEQGIKINISFKKPKPDIKQEKGNSEPGAQGIR